jgi:hypothetical protein
MCISAADIILYYKHRKAHGAVSLSLRGIRRGRRDFLPAAGAGRYVGVIGPGRFAVIPILGRLRSRGGRLGRCACRRCLLDDYRRLLYYDRRNIGVGIGVNRRRIEIPDARRHPPPSQVSAMPAMNPVAATPAMHVMCVETADVSSAPTPFVVIRQGRLRHSQQDGGGERCAEYRFDHHSFLAQFDAENRERISKGWAKGCAAV